MIAVIGVAVAVVVALIYTQLMRRAEKIGDGVISQAALGSATARDRQHRERLERRPGDDALVQRISREQRPVYDSRFLRGGKGRRTA